MIQVTFIHDNLIYYMDCYETTIHNVNFDTKTVTIRQGGEDTIIDIWAFINGKIQHFDVINFDNIRIVEGYYKNTDKFIVSNATDIKSVGNN